MTIKQHGGIFGRNPSFNAAYVNSLNGTTLSSAGLALLDDADAAAQRTTLGLGSAATTASTDYATAAQGSLADSALQPADVGTIASQDADNVNIDGGAIDGAAIGANSESTGKFSTLDATSTTTLKPDGSTSALIVDTGGVRTGTIANRMHQLGSTNIAGAQAIKRSSGNSLTLTLTCNAQASIYRHGYLYLICASEDSGAALGDAAWFLFRCRSSLSDAYPVINTTAIDSGGDTGTYTITVLDGVVTVTATATHDNITVSADFAMFVNNANIT